MSTDVLELAYRNKLKQTHGVPPTINQLLQAVTKFGITRRQVAAYLRTKTVHGQFADAKKVRLFQTLSVPRPGIFFVDYAEFHKNWGPFHNSGNTGFLVCVENLTNKLFVFPCKDKSAAAWTAAIEGLIRNTGYVTTIYSDRDSVATSPDFQREVSQKYNIRWYFLRQNSKSYLAERYIRYVKEKLSQAMVLASSKNWIQFVSGLLSEYNNEVISGTRYKRKAVDPSNFNDFLSQILKRKHPELIFNRARIAPFLNPNWNKALFAFAPGDKVLLARRAMWQEKLEGGRFFKTSHHGSFSPTIYTIAARQLRATKGFNRYVAVYSLSNLQGWFYERNLKRID